MEGVSYKQQLRFAISGLWSRDLEAPSVAAARAVLRGVRDNAQHLRAALLDILAGIDAAPRHAARCRLQLAEYAVLECLEHQQLTNILPRLSQQANIVLAAHRQDAGCINSLAALLTSCMAKLLLEPQGSYAAIHGASKGSTAAHASREVVTADFLCEALLFPVINSTYRDPEQTRVSAGSVVLLGLFEVLKGHTDQAAVIDAVRRCLGLMLQLMGAGTVAQRAPGVLLPVCSCVEVLGLSMDRDGTRRLLKLALKAATTPHTWQVRRDACQALAVLAASLQFRALPPLEGEQLQPPQPELVLTPAVELLIAQKPSVMQVLEDVRYDKIAAVRTTAAAAWAEFTALPDPPPADDATPAGRADKATGSSVRPTAKPSSTKRSPGGCSPLKDGRKRPAPPRFVRPKLLPKTERDFGVLVFAPPPPPPPPEPEPEPEAADTSQAHSTDQSPIARQLQFEADTSLRASVDASSQTCAEGATPTQQPYSVQSPLSGGSNPFFATSSSPSPGHSVEHPDLQQLQHQLQQQLQQQPGLPALLAATGFGGSPVRLDISHHVHGRVEVGVAWPGIDGTGSPGATAQAPSHDLQLSSQAHSPEMGAAAGVAAGVVAAAAAAASNVGAHAVCHSVQTTHPLSGLEVEQQQWQEQQQAWAKPCAVDMAFEPSFGLTAGAAASGSMPSDSLRGSYASLQEPAGALAAAAGSLCSELQHPPPLELASLQHAEELLVQHSPDTQQQQQAAAADDPSAASSTSPHSLASTAEQGWQQRQRWQVQPLSCSPPGSADVSEAPSRQCTPAAGGTPPRSPSSLEVLRSVGERVQHLLEHLQVQTLSRQTSASSRQGSRSPVASLAGRPVQGPPTSPGAPPLPRTTRRSSSGCASSSSGANDPLGNESVAVAAAYQVVGQPTAEQQLVQLQKQLPAVVVVPHASDVQQRSQHKELEVAYSPVQPDAGGSPQQDEQSVVVEPCSPAAAVQQQLAMQWSAHDVVDAAAVLAVEEQRPQDPQHQQQLCADAVSQELDLQSEQQGQGLVCASGYTQLLQEFQGSTAACSEVQPLRQLQCGEDAADERQVLPLTQLPPTSTQVVQPSQAVEALSADSSSNSFRSADDHAGQTMGAGALQSYQLPPHLQQDDETEQSAVEPHTSSGASAEPAAAHGADSSAWQALELAGSLSAPPAGQTPPAASAAADSSSAPGRPLPPEKQPQQQEEDEVPGQEPGQPWCVVGRTVVLPQDAPVKGDILTEGVADCPDDSSSEPLSAADSSAPQCAAEQERQLQLEAMHRPHVATQESPRQRQPPQSQLQQQAEQEEHVQPPSAVQDMSHPAGMQQPEPGMQALCAVQVQDSGFDLGKQLHPSCEQRGAEASTLDDATGGVLAGGSTGAAAGPLQPSMLGVAGAALEPFSMQYNDLFQPAPAAAQGTGGLGAQNSAASLNSAGTQAAVTAPVSAVVASAQQAALLASGGAGGMSRVDQALEKLHSLRTTLRSISSSGGAVGGGEHNSLPGNIAGASLSGSRTASPPLGSREDSSSMLQLPVQRSSGVLSNKHSAQALTAGVGCHLPASASFGGGSETGSALASAKDWIRQISQRLQQVSSSTPEVLDTVPGGAAGTGSASGLAAVADAAAADSGGAVMPSNSSGEASSAAWATQVAAADGQDGSMPRSHQEATEPGVGGHQQPTSPPECCIPAGGPGSDEGLLLDSQHQPLAAASVEHLQEQATADSAAWSTLTASTSSSGSSVGSQQLPNLQDAQQQGSQQPDVQEVDASGAAERPASPSEGSVAGTPGGVAPTQQQLWTESRMPQPASGQEPSSPQQQQQEQPREGELLEAEASSTAVVPQGAADEATVTMVESEQRLQRLLSCQDEDTMLLMAFTLKLDRLGRRFQPHHAEGQGGAAPLCLTASPGTAWQTPQPQQRLDATPGSPGGDDSSPPGPWTSITHNTLFNASPASTPQKKLSQGAACADEAAEGRGQAGDCVASAGAAVSPVAASPQAALGSLSAVMDDEAAAFTVQLQDAVLQSVLGVGLEEVRSGSAQAVDAVACVLAGLGRQLADAAPATVQPVSALIQQQPQLILLREDLRAELRWRCAQHIAAGGTAGAHGGGSGSSAASRLAAGLSSLQEHLFEQDVLPVVLRCVERGPVPMP